MEVSDSGPRAGKATTRALPIFFRYPALSLQIYIDKSSIIHLIYSLDSLPSQPLDLERVHMKHGTRSAESGSHTDSEQHPASGYPERIPSEEECPGSRSPAGTAQSVPFLAGMAYADITGSRNVGAANAASR